MAEPGRLCAGVPDTRRLAGTFAVKIFFKD